MLKQGQKVQQLTKKVGQVPKTGTVIALHGESAEVRWEDGHVSIVSRGSLYPATQHQPSS